MASSKDKPVFGQGGSAVAEHPKDVLQTAKDMAGTAADKAKEMASGAVDKAKDVASTAATKAGEAASFVGDKAQQATSAVGAGMQSLAGTIREHTPHEGVMGSASKAVAETLESGGRYLQQEGLKGIADDTTNLIRRNPIPAVLIGIGLGFLLARATRS